MHTPLSLRLFTLAAAATLASCVSVSTRPAAAPQISEETIRRVTTMLSSDAFEGRSPGTAGEERSVNYLIEQMRAAGLQPGNHGSWVQDVPLVEMTANNVSPLRFDTPAGVQSLSYGDDFVAGSYRITPRTDIANSEVVFVGYGINAPERGWNDYEGIDVHGKTVVILVNDPDWQVPAVGGTFNGRAMTYYGRWTYKYEEAARQGAAAAIIVHDTEPAAYGWGVVRSSWTGAQYLADAADNHMTETQANGWMQLHRATALFRAAGLDFDRLRAQAGRAGFRAIALPSVTASLSFDNAVRRTASRNVIGILPGRTRPGDYILYTAHWDHLGRCEADAAGDDICNGAIDNATGVGGLVALAEAHARAGAAERTLVFLAVTAEESGLLGSHYYAENPVFPLAQTVGGINMDALNGNGPARDVVVVGRGKSDLDTYLDRALTAAGRYASDEPTPERGFYYRSDHFSLAKLGVPMIYFDGGEDLIEGGRAAGRAAAEDYTANRYHKPSDELEAIARWDGMTADVALYYAVGRALAMSAEWPNWVEGDEFRAIRDRSRAGR
ncbi:MAG: M28 family metallopeptidase [Sphingopyxis sp.]